MTAWTRTGTPNDIRLADQLRAGLSRVAFVAAFGFVAAAVIVLATSGLTVPAAAFGAVGLLSFAGGLALRPSADPVEAAPPPLSGLVRTGSISSDVLLDYDLGTASKVYRPTRPVKLLYALSFQARFPYTDKEAAFTAALLRREIAGTLTEAWFGDNMVAQTLSVRPNGDGRYVFVTELVRGTAPRDRNDARAFLNRLAARFEESGLPLWQVAPYNPRAIGNLIEGEDGSYRVIDLESNLVTPFLPPRALVRAIRAGRYPSFDEIDTERLSAYLAANADMLAAALGPAKAARLAVAANEYARAQNDWHASEARIASKVLRFAFRAVDVPSWFRAMKRLTSGGERMAANVANSGIDAWVAEGVLTEDQGEAARAQLATPEMTVAMANLGAHLAITVPLRFPLGSIARTGWTLALRARGEWAALRGKAPAASSRRIHSFGVALLAFVPGLGSFAYLAARPFRQEPVIRAVALDQALRHVPANGYRRLHLQALTRSMATSTPPASASARRRLLRMAPAVLAGAAGAAAIVAASTLADIGGASFEVVAGGTLVLAGIASIAAFRAFWKRPEDADLASQAGSFFWLMAGAGLVALGIDLGLGVHEAAANAIDGLGLPMVPGAEEAHVLMLAGYVLTAAGVAWGFRGEVLSGRASAGLVVAGGSLAAAALAFEAGTGDAATGALLAGGLVMLAAAAARILETGPAPMLRRDTLPGRRLPGGIERSLDRVEPAVRELARSRWLLVKLLGVSAVVVGLSAGAGLAIWGEGNEHQLFRDIGPVTFFSSTLLLLGGAMGLASWRRSRETTGRPFYGDLWAAWGLGFIALALEQPTDLHGRLGGWIADATGVAHPLGFNATSDALVAVYGLVGIGVTALLARQLFEHPTAIARFALAVPAVAFFIAIDGFFGHSDFNWVMEESVELVAAAFFVAGFAERYRRALRARREERAIVEWPADLRAAA